MDRSWIRTAFVLTLSTLTFNLLFAAAFALPLVSALELLA